MSRELKHKIFILIEQLLSMNFPLVEYARNIDLDPQWEDVVKLEVKFIRGCGEEPMVCFDLAELKTVKILGQHRRTIIEMEESMRQMKKKIQAMRDEVEMGKHF
jgi:hypothetical protein